MAHIEDARAWPSCGASVLQDARFCAGQVSATSVNFLVVMKVRARDATSVRRSEGGPVVATRPSLRDRVTALLRRGRLDRALADGAGPESSPALALRARRLTDISNRRAIADALRGIVRQAQRVPSPSYIRVSPCHRRVKGSSRDLVQLADALSRPGPVAPCGVAQARLLLTDGTGPLYDPRSPEDLRALVVRAAQSLRTR